MEHAHVAESLWHPVLDGQPSSWGHANLCLDVQDVSEARELDAKRARTGSGPE